MMMIRVIIIMIVIITIVIIIIIMIIKMMIVIMILITAIKITFFDDNSSLLFFALCMYGTLSLGSAMAASISSKTPGRAEATLSIIVL